MSAKDEEYEESRKQAIIGANRFFHLVKDLVDTEMNSKPEGSNMGQAAFNCLGALLSNAVFICQTLNDHWSDTSMTEAQLTDAAAGLDACLRIHFPAVFDGVDHIAPMEVPKPDNLN